MFEPKLKNCLIACKTDVVNRGGCECHNNITNESGPHTATPEFQSYLNAFCAEMKYTPEDVYRDPALFETVWNLYKSIKQI
jgi:hypothetical protein